ncbi:MAG: CHAT domain-containing protein, partial [Flavobacteriales bacterium]|nr:CHAT domain-containing protein [Flavobacteriales bacterium]
IRKKVYGNLHLETIKSQTNAAYYFSFRGDHEKCISLLNEIKDPAISKYGLYKSFEIQNIFAALAHCHKAAANYKKADEYALRAKNIAEKIFDPLSSFIGDSYNQLSEINVALEKYELALSYQLTAAKLDSERNISNYILSDVFNIDNQTDNIFDYIAKLVILKSWKPEEFSAFNYDDAFELIQSISDIKASKALKKSSLRILEENDKINDIIKNIQDLEISKKNIRTQIIDNFLNNEDSNLNLQLEEKLLNIETTIENQNIVLQDIYPNYFNLIRPHNSSIKEIQDLINLEESLLSFFIDEKFDFIYLIYISNDVFDIKIIDYNYDELKNDINTIRSSLDTISLRDFNFDISHKVYNKLIKPVESYIKDKDQLLIIPDKVLFKIPFSVLVQETYKGTYKSAPWLINDYSIVNLPSINSLKYLHDKDAIQSENLSYIGFGDPILSNYSDNSYRGVFDNIDEITKLDSLPETKDELLGIAEILGNENGNIYLGKEATETKFKELEFEDINLLLFATHGLVSGELKGLDEPGLVMTPPPQASNEDNGILSASEILSFNFPSLDLVVLSACNTSAGTSKNPEELSGLTRSFFYAGANSLLVSHWPVESDSAVKLTTNMFKYIKEDNLSKGYALQKSMKDFIQNADKDYLAHPIFWAPFMLVGGN